LDLTKKQEKQNIRNNELKQELLLIKESIGKNPHTNRK